MKVVAFVPMRHHSVRVPGKNYRTLGGIPLYRHIVATLGQCPSVTEVVIDTDSDVIRRDAAQAFPHVRVLERPAHLRAGEIPMTEILVHDASQVEADVYVQTHSTNPFLTAATIERALEAWRKERDRYDSLFTVTRIQARLWSHEARPLNHDPLVLLQTQNLSPIYLENSCLYAFERELILSKRQRIGDRPLLFEIDPLEAVDIDEERDFAFAELLIRARDASRM